MGGWGDRWRLLVKQKGKRNVIWVILISSHAMSLKFKSGWVKSSTVTVHSVICWLCVCIGMIAVRKDWRGKM